jgi:hypothetical protein
MIRLATLIETFEADFREQYRDRLTPEIHHALAAMKHCRTQTSLKMRVECGQCAHRMLVPHACGHRHCPHCQHHETQQWLERQMRKLVPAEYFLLTFTLPAELRPLARAQPNLIYDLLMRCSWDTVRTFSQNDKQLRGTPGAIAVLHTHTRRLDFHPHVHLVMPAAALDKTRKKWRCKRAKKGRYLFNHTALAKVFRAKMLAACEAAGLTLPPRYPKQWVVDCKSVGTGQKALIYLGRYLYRGVISEKNIIACEDGQVTFRLIDAKTKKTDYRTVPGAQFLWLILQHVLPKGFRRSRNFGFMHPNCKRLIALLHLLLKFNPGQPPPNAKTRAPISCPCCGAVMTIVQTRIRISAALPAPPPINDVSRSALTM